MFLTKAFITTDASGNVYFTDGNRIRVVGASGLVATFAGSTTGGYSGDGGLAIAAQLGAPHGVCFDPSGNMYVSDHSNNRIRKISSSGIITTIAGTGGVGFSGDGALATGATFQALEGICIDATGNLFVADRLNNRVRRIDPSGVITTYAGNGSAGFSGDGGLATAAELNSPTNVCADSYGNLYIADYTNDRVRRVTPSGIISTFAGGGFGTPANVPATSTSFGRVWGICVDNYNNVYIADRGNLRVCKVEGIPPATHVADSFSVHINPLCAGPAITVLAANYSPALQVKTWFGDGALRIDSFSGIMGASWFNHSYSSPGTYSVKHVLYNGSSRVDSLQYTYSHLLCNTFQVGFYYDANGNCVKDVSDIILSHPVLIEVDSNSVAIDTLSAIAGMYYNAQGIAGDVFSFKVIDLPSGFHLSCPASGIIYDTLGAGVSTKFVAVECGTASSFDLGIHAVIPITGVQDQLGDIYVKNAYCAPKNATITLHYSPKYAGAPSVIPSPVSVSGNSITWNISALSSAQPAPVKIHYSLWKGATALTIGDTVHSYFTITPGTGDVDTVDNDQDDVDTVKAGCDPNYIWVSPEGCMPLGVTTTALKYTVNFENTGNDTAHNIYVLDTLSDYLDASSMRIVMASHEMYVSKSKDATGHIIVKFDFPNIKLLDSSHHGLCDGAFIYTINTKPGIPAGEKVHGRVGIYFDVNEVVLTNTVENEKACPPSLAVSAQLQTKLMLYPNPVSDELVVKADQNVFTSFTITNSIGQEIIQKQIGGGQTRVNVRVLPAGIYYVVFTGAQGREMVKFVKE